MAIREGFGTVTPYLLTPDVDALVRFLARAFGAVETHRERGGAGGWHAELRLGDSMLMVGGPAPSSEVMLFLYVEDPDAWYQRALKEGATSLEAPNRTAGGRRAAVTDPQGNRWYFGGPLPS
jgi:PhnB protein